MKVGSKEIGMLYTVRASIALGKLNGGHSVTSFFENMVSGDDEVDFHKIIDAVKILHEAYDRKMAADEAKEGRIYTPTEINEDEFFDLEMWEWNDVMKDVIKCIQDGSKLEVETEPEDKKKEKKKETD